MMDRQIDSPIPTPPGFVVQKSIENCEVARNPDHGERANNLMQSINLVLYGGSRQMQIVTPANSRISPSNQKVNQLILPLQTIGFRAKALNCRRLWASGTRTPRCGIRARLTVAPLPTGYRKIRPLQ
jgi:hypothetical protein